MLWCLIGKEFDAERTEIGGYNGLDIRWVLRRHNRSECHSQQSEKRQAAHFLILRRCASVSLTSLDSCYKRPMRRLLAVGAVVGVSWLGLQAQDDNNLTVIHRIKVEAFDNSKVMDELANISDLYGPLPRFSRRHRNFFPLPLRLSWPLFSRGARTVSTREASART
jgi:hypothetical protein